MLNIVLGAVSLGLLWAIMTLGVFLTYRILDYACLLYTSKPTEYNAKKAMIRNQ